MNTKTTHHKLVIIGSGPAGLTAGIYAARSNLQPVVVEGKEPGGQLMGTTAVENWPGTIAIMGPKLMITMREQAEKLGCHFESGEVTHVTLQQKPFVITIDTGKTLTADALIIATGATPKKLGIPGEQEYWGKGVTTCAICDGAFYKQEPVVIVGGGDTAMEDASFMTKFTDDITVIQVLDTLTASHAMQQRVLNNPGIKIILNSSVTKIMGDDKGHASAVMLKNQKTGKEETIPARAVFIAIGLHPNTNLFKGQLAMNPQGYLLVTDHTRSSIDGVFIAGDVADYRYRQAITAAGAGCMAALDAEHYLKSLE